MTTQNPVQMANQVANLFASCLKAEAISGATNDLTSIWSPRMRREIAPRLKVKAGAGPHIAMDAAKRIAARGAAKKSV